MVRWNDNSVVTVCSNVFSVDSLNKVKRYNEKEKKNIYISQPDVIVKYNRSIEGIDVNANKIQNYRCQVTGKNSGGQCFVTPWIVSIREKYLIMQIIRMSQLHR